MIQSLYKTITLSLSNQTKTLQQTPFFIYKMFMLDIIMQLDILVRLTPLVTQQTPLKHSYK